MVEERYKPIYSVERSGVAELTIYGAIAAVQGLAPGQGSETVLSLGDTGRDLWMRSVLKPWQLLSHIDTVKTAYPTLRPEHIALMMASHSAEPFHLALLDEIAEIGGLSEEALRCPATYPQEATFRAELQAKNAPARRLYHNCSGKHYGYMLAIKAEGGNPADYWSPEGEHFRALQELICALLHRPLTNLPVTTDGCQLPNYAVSLLEMARLYYGLTNPDEYASTDSYGGLVHTFYPEIVNLMREYARLIGGTSRLDTSIMSGGLKLKGDPTIVAKEGAEGLLTIGVGACEELPHGLGLVIKLSSGFESRHMEIIAKKIFAQLGLCEHPSGVPVQPSGTRTDHLQSKFHFQINQKQHA